MSVSTVSINNSRGQSTDTIYTAGGTKKLKLAIGSKDIGGDTEDGAWQAVASHADGAAFASSDGIVVIGGVDPDTDFAVRLQVDADGKLLVASSAVGGTLTDHSGSIAAGATAQSLMSSNASRKYLFIQNVSDTDMWINFGTTAVADQPSIKVEAGTAFAMESAFVSTQSISIICASISKKFVAKEG